MGWRADTPETGRGGNGLKVKLCVSRERYQEIKDALLDHGIEIDDHADLIISERSCFEDHLMVKNLKTNERMVLSTCEIISIESFGHFFEVHTQDEVYQAVDRLYRIEGQLDPARFLRISHSVIIARDKIKTITPTLSMKFMVLCQDLAQVKMRNLSSS